LQVEQELTERNPESKQTQMDFMGKLGAKGGQAIRVSFDAVHSCFIGYEVVVSTSTKFVLISAK
jgi:hypothetical protein